MFDREFWRNARQELWQPGQANIPSLDGLRGFASCIVVFYHCAIFMGYYEINAQGALKTSWVVSLTNGFWTGIDIFFVLSGFLIGRILIRDLSKEGRLHYIPFFVRRSFRIFPAYYLVISISLFVIAPLNLRYFDFMYLTSDWNVLLKGAWTNYLYVVNYFQPGTEPSILSWGWSLAVEEHFYLLLPPLLYCLFKSRFPWVHLTGLSAFIALPFIGRFAQYILNPDLNILDGFYYLSHNRFDEIFVGVLIAYFYVMHFEQLKAFSHRAGGAVLGGLGLIGAGSVWIFGGLNGDGIFIVVFQFLLMAMSTGLIVLNCLFLKNGLTAFFAHSAWYPLARVSYGTYLVHPFILFGLMETYRSYITTQPFELWEIIPFYLAVMLLSSLLAALMFILLEAPMLRLGVNISRKYRQAARPAPSEAG